MPTRRTGNTVKMKTQHAIIAVSAKRAVKCFISKYLLQRITFMLPSLQHLHADRILCSCCCCCTHYLFCHKKTKRKKNNVYHVISSIRRCFSATIFSRLKCQGGVLEGTRNYCMLDSVTKMWFRLL